MVDVMQAEKSYDAIPNFTAVDAMRILGIGTPYIFLYQNYLSLL